MLRLAGRPVMHEASQESVAEAGVGAGVEHKGMPRLVNDGRWGESPIAVCGADGKEFPDLAELPLGFVERYPLVPRELLNDILRDLRSLFMELRNGVHPHTPSTSRDGKTKHEPHSPINGHPLSLFVDLGTITYTPKSDVKRYVRPNTAPVATESPLGSPSSTNLLRIYSYLLIFVSYLFYTTFMARLFSGIQPTGILHIGNYVGAIKQWIPLQNEYESFFCIVDLHAITVPYDPAEMKKQVLNVAATYLAAGLDPNKAVIFVQSHVPEHTELMWLLNTITPVGQLFRMTQFKEKARPAGMGFSRSVEDAQSYLASAGLLNYPVLMAADILLYKAVLVPVGEDQRQHVELTRDLAEKFNRQFGETFPLPNYQLNEGARIMALNDPAKKMSKSIPGSFIALTDSDDEIRKKIGAAVTDVGPRKTGDGGRKTDMSPGVRNLFTLLKLFSTERVYSDFINRYEAGDLQYADLKARLAEDIIQVLTPIRKRHAELMEEPDKLRAILAAGADAARPIAQKTIREVKEKMGL